MNSHELTRLLRLAKKTGDTLIIAGENSEDSVVIMPVDRYEDLIGEDEFDPEVFNTFSENLEEVLPIDEIPTVVADAPEERAFEPEPRVESIKEPVSAEPKTGVDGEEERFYLESMD